MQVFNSSDKQKHRMGGPVKGDVLKASNVGKLQVLKSVREKNVASPITKDNSLSPTGGSKVVSPSLASPSVSGPTATRGLVNNPVRERKPAFTVLEKRPTSQAQSRNEFFNSVRKKSMGNSSSFVDSPTPNSSSATSPSSSDKAEMEARCDTSLGFSLGVDHLSEIRGDTVENGAAFDIEKHVSNGKKHPSLDLSISEEEGAAFIRSMGSISEEKEAALLRSMGWEEPEGDEGGLTEEEINAFLNDATKVRYMNPLFIVVIFSPPFKLAMLLI